MSDTEWLDELQEAAGAEDVKVQFHLPRHSLTVMASVHDREGVQYGWAREFTFFDFHKAGAQSAEDRRKYIVEVVRQEIRPVLARAKGISEEPEEEREEA